MLHGCVRVCGLFVEKLLLIDVQEKVMEWCIAELCNRTAHIIKNKY
jgi:hypothetical protein